MAGAAQTAQGLLTNYLFYGQRRRAEVRDQDEAATAAASNAGRGDSVGERASDLPTALAGLTASAPGDPAASRAAARQAEAGRTGTVLQFGLRTRRGTPATGAAAVATDPLAVDALAAAPPDDPLTALAQRGATELPAGRDTTR
jgi:hypothetical protein